MPPAVARWLFDTASLTRRLRARCPGGFAVRVLRQRRQRPGFSERRLLDLPMGAMAVVREVQLQCHGRPWVFARTVIPLHTLTGRCRRLSRLGTRPLGEMLFTSPGMRRYEVQVARLVPGQPLFAAATAGLRPCPAEAWGRRSVFALAGRPLLVTEIFLPELLGRASDSGAGPSVSMRGRR